MRKAEEEAIRRAKKEIVRLRGAEEVGVLGGLVGGLEYEEGSGVAEDVMGDEEEDVDMGSDGED